MTAPEPVLFQIAVSLAVGGTAAMNATAVLLHEQASSPC
jgi:hypothetical protein